MKYEFTFIVPEEKEATPIKQLLQSLEGKMTEEQKWGKKELAYPIQKLMDAYYFTWIIELSPKNLSEFKKKLNFNEKLMRYLLLKVE